ncbi:MAG: ATP-binding protein [Deltaproteobacteria bacterium]|nr:ATP-binding protein [Deltaproteobacteria bacterium]
MYARTLKKPSNSFFLFGPRGTGKSTWTKTVLKDAIYIDLLDSRVFNALEAYPDRLESYFPKGFDGWVIIDEVQRIPAILNEVHRLIENRGICFVLTGSSARKLRRKGTNLLAGRAATCSMFPLTAVELGNDFDLEQAVQFGLLPMSISSTEPSDFLHGYVKTYLKEEVQQEGLTRNMGAFSRFLEAASFSQGSPLNISAVARDCGVERKVVESYFSILDDLLIGFRLPAFQKKAKRRLVRQPKFYFFDVGVYRAIRPKGPLDYPEEIGGIALETLVFQELRAAAAYSKLDYELYYFRTSNQTEVDFVLYGERGITAIEVKQTATLRGRDFKGLRSFKRDYPMARTIMLYRGQQEMSQGDEIEIIPVGSFLCNMYDYL